MAAWSRRCSRRSGPEPIATRVTIGEANVLVTTTAIYRRKIAKVRDQLTTVRHILLVDQDQTAEDSRAPLSLHRLMAQAGDDAPSRHTPPPTTRRCCISPAAPPAARRRAPCTCGAVAMHYITGRYALDLHDDDICWCTADPGWVTGTTYGIIAPLLHGVTSIVDEAGFDAERWYRILRDEQVTVCTPPPPRSGC